MHEWLNRWASVLGLALMALGVVVPSSSGAQTTEWRAYGGDVGGTNYSPRHAVALAGDLESTDG
jgi:hypothetical protein